MKNGPLFIIGLFAALTVSWVTMVLCANAQMGDLTPYYDDNEGNSFPQRTSGIAAQGEYVYRDLGCVACHTQQVRRPDYGSDQARGWGERQSVARDYIFQARPQLGSLRYGPDLANFGAHKPEPEPQELMKFLYAGSETHPSYRFLFATKPIVGEQSSRALKLGGRHSAPAGEQIVPTARAEALVAYLISLKQSYEYPEARPAAPEAPAHKGHAAEKAKPGTAPQKAVNTEASPATEKSDPPGKRPEQAVPAAAPDEKKKQEK